MPRRIGLGHGIIYRSSKTGWQSLGDQCQGGGGGFLSVLPTSPSGQRDHRRFHLYLSTPTPLTDSRAILALKGNLSNSTASGLSRRGRKTFSVGKVRRAGEGGGGGGGLGGREGGGPSRLRLANVSIAAGLPTCRRTWRPSGAAGRCFRGRRGGGRGDPPASPS